MRSAARSSSSAPVTTRRTLRSLSHFSARPVVAPGGRYFGKRFEMHGSRGGIAREPGLLGREAEHRREPSHGGSKQMIEHSEAGLARHRRIRIAIEHVFPDIEIEGRQIDRQESAQPCKNAFVVEVGIGLADKGIELSEPMQHQAFQLRHCSNSNAIGRMEMRQVAEHPAQRVAKLAIGVDRGGGFPHRCAGRRRNRRRRPTCEECRRRTSSSPPAAL